MDDIFELLCLSVLTKIWLCDTTSTPYLTYCLEVCGCAYATHLQCLFLLSKSQKKSVITFSYYLAHTDPFFLSGNFAARKFFIIKVV